MIDKLIGLDIQLFLWLNSLHSPVFDKIMWVISHKVTWVPFYLILIGYIIYKFRWRGIPIILSIIIAITLADQIGAKVFKEGFERLRPSHNPSILHMVHIVNGYRGGLYGFVSNHAANSFALSIFLGLLFRNRWLWAGMLFWALIVSYSRIYLGVHYPADILGGAILGSTIAWLMNLTRKKLQPYTNRLLPAPPGQV